MIRNWSLLPPPDPDDATALPGTGSRALRRGLPVVVLSIVSALATYLILTGLTSIAPRDDVVLLVLLINALLMMAMFGIIAWHIAGLVRAWRNKVAGARLHVRIVVLFSVIAAVPAILLAIAATNTFSRSLDTWFSGRVRDIIENSNNVARAYLDEHGQVIRTDIVNMARDLDDAEVLVRSDPRQFQQLVIAQAGLRDLPVAYVIDAASKPVVTAIEDDRIPYLAPPASVIAQAEAGQVPLLMPTNGYRVAAVTKLARYPGRYLYVARGVNPEVIRHLRRTAQSADEYQRLRHARGGLKIAHGLMYLMISMTALLAALWAGMWFAGRFVAPIGRLIAAAQDVSRGNLMVELPIRKGEGDLRRLSETFNRMTRELKSQRDALVSTNERLSERSRFIEAMLSGVSAGVIGLDSEGRITLVNRSAERLLGARADDLVGEPLATALPPFAELLIEGRDAGALARSHQQHQITYPVGTEDRTLAVQITREEAGGADVGSVITFDDITELVSAQRTSAWADVARRIAHEIKNPLTPIQLSAERIRRKYGKVIVEDRETFDNLTATIERQVGDIKSMVDEFASFARIPKPMMEPGDLRDAARDSVILFREAHRGVTYTLIMPETAAIGRFDRRLLTQAITNLVKNATEAVEAAAEAPDREPGWRPEVETRVSLADDCAEILVVDNGIGLPRQNRTRLLEPYVTTKGHKGTGLGLAIVQKIVEQHGGALSLEDAPPAPGRSRGAAVRITIPMRGQTGEERADGAPAGRRVLAAS